MSFLLCGPVVFFFFFNDTATTEIYTLSLHDALPISLGRRGRRPQDWWSPAPLSEYASAEPHPRTVPGSVRLRVRSDAGAVSARPLTPPASRFHVALLGVGRAAHRGRAPAPHPTAVLAPAATGLDRAAAAGHRAVAPGHAGLRAARSCADPGYFRLDGPANIYAHSEGPGPRTPPRLCPRRARARSHHAGARRRPYHSRHGLRTRPAETRRSHRPIRARRHRVEPGPGARLCTADSGAERTPRRRSGLRGHGQPRRTRTGQAGPAQPAVLERARCGR